ncbi:glycosyltransferase family 4 protein [Pontibacter silvestris]|uniref:Glycosyltransferase family 4 protein n=1 Tax=Pontibacter silvestris TaxID=2305183 RepID=A0ABW4WYP7_9BACT|nr:glycosyltransferase family 4 protein [Pontibacter silvestris]MCC9137336.1 glycosyltransferase family 4 protein [Pontibacter silvestris]
MKILYYSSHPNLNLASPSGYGTHMREMIAAFEALGHKVKPVIMGGVAMDSKSLTIEGRKGWKKKAAKLVPAYLWESAKDYSLLKFDTHAKQVLEKAVIAYQPDLIYERAAYLQLSGVNVAQKHNVKHVLEVNAPYAEERIALQGKSVFTGKGELFEKSQLEKANRIVVVSSALKKHLSSVHKIPEKKFVVTPNAINPALVEKGNEPDVAQKQQSVAGKVVIGFVGSIFPWHGVDLLISAFSKLTASTKKQLHLLIVGDGEILPHLKQQAASLGLSGKVSFTGNVPHQEVFDYIAQMDICVSPKSHWYGSPVKIFEYGALGKAIIAPDNVPVRDVMEHKKTGLLVQPSVESIHEALAMYLQDETLRMNCAAKFKEKVLSEHTWQHNAAKVIGAIQ